jgi:hypothetical protein
MHEKRWTRRAAQKEPGWAADEIFDRLNEITMVYNDLIYG